MGQAHLGGCTYEHLATVTGFDVDAVKRILAAPLPRFEGVRPADDKFPPPVGPALQSTSVTHGEMSTLLGIVEPPPYSG
jgi:hypothetical protein